ncbi:rho GTPase-activating protein 11A isoform X1 [Trichomycterus rosablanca]|uniref:rho GTPase-activating protein 11A isoform X1 n=1 Tax=Trichomycterus rosablanca TaxID=2290929 RepID=UPI002F3509BA
MKTVDRNVVRLAIVQHLRATYGIKTKNWNKCKNKATTNSSLKVFGVALDSLPHCHILDFGDIPCFVVDASTFLMAHLDTEGLFRKSGSVVRVKALKAKLDQAEECMSTALPSDIAGLLKQFFRELPEPVLPTDLQSAFLKAQELSTTEERTSATMLLSCVLPNVNVTTLHYFCSFLKSVSQRSAENKMDSSNLSVIFAPNLFHCGDGTEKVNASTEKKLKLQAAVVQCLIDNSEHLGKAPDFILAKVPAMLGCDVRVFSPSDALEEGSTPSGVKRCRRSLGVISSGTPVVTPKRKLPIESEQSYGFSTKKRRSIKKNLGLELLPNALFGGASTPGSVHSASGTLESGQNAPSSVGRSSRLTASSARRKSKRLIHINRVESGKAGCFSPRVSKKEAMRKSLRLRFSIGKSSRDCSVNSHSQPEPKGSEVIGWRLATQESIRSFHFTKDTPFSPAVLKSSASKGAISKSEDNLLTPHDAKKPGTSWREHTPDGTHAFTENSLLETPMKACLSYRSEPTIVISKPPIAGSLPKSLCCATSSESLASSESFNEESSQVASTPLKIRGAFDESDRVCHTADTNNSGKLTEQTEAATSSSNHSDFSNNLDEPKDSVQTPLKILVNDHDATCEHIRLVPLSPLHIDSTLFEHTMNTSKSSPNAESKIGSSFPEGSKGSVNCSRLIDALDIQSPVAFRLNSSITIQSTPYAGLEQTGKLNTSQPEEFKQPESAKKSARSKSRQGDLLGPKEPPRIRVADQVQRFNKLTLESPKGRVIRAPLKFQRTPVRQSVRRFNSLEKRKDARSGWCATSQSTIKAASLESGHFGEAQQHCPAYEDSNDKASCSNTKQETSAQKSANTVRLCALGDVTNTVTPKAKGDGTSAPKGIMSEFAKTVHQTAEKAYRGSPWNPLTQGKLLSAMKPIDL